MLAPASFCVHSQEKQLADSWKRIYITNQVFAVLNCVKTQNYLIQFQNIIFLTIRYPKGEPCMEQKNFFTCYSCSYFIPVL